MSKYNVGDKFIVEIKEIDELENYMITPDIAIGIDLLDKLQKCETELSWDEAYNKGLNDAWELTKKLWLPTSYGGKNGEEVMKIFGCDYYAISKLFTPQEALAKLEAYEKEQAEIKVGDVVTVDNGDIKFICTKDNSNGDYTKCHLMASDGSIWEECNKKILVKTGKHIDIQSILQQIGGE